MPFILSLAASLLGWGKIALAWVTAFVTRNPLLALALALAIACGVLVWRNDWLAEQRNQARADQVQAEAALKVEQASNARLTTAITAQNAAVATLGADSAQAQAQGAQADAAAVARSAARAAQSNAIIVPPATTPPQADCRTPDDVMAVKGKL